MFHELYTARETRAEKVKPQKRVARGPVNASGSHQPWLVGAGFRWLFRGEATLLCPLNIVHMYISYFDSFLKSLALSHTNKGSR